MQTDKGTTFKWGPFRHLKNKKDKFHDVIEEDGASSNTPLKVCIEAKVSPKLDEDNNGV